MSADAVALVHKRKEKCASALAYAYDDYRMMSKRVFKGSSSSSSSSNDALLRKIKSDILIFLRSLPASVVNSVGNIKDIRSEFPNAIE